MSHTFEQGTSPLLVSFPHNGSHIPPEIAAIMTAAGKTSRDTDWFLDRLYDFPELADASKIVSQVSRYVIDLNRPQNDESLYPGQTTTGLIPSNRFDGSAIYESEFGVGERQRRITKYWKPYHEKIELELSRLVNEFGVAVLLEAHSIESRLPSLFDGVLPDLNIGTNCKSSCDPSLSAAVMDKLSLNSDYSHVINGRFRGGYITRHYGDPNSGVHALQIELSQATYLDEWSKRWDSVKANQVQLVLRDLVGEIKRWLNWKRS